MIIFAKKYNLDIKEAKNISLHENKTNKSDKKKELKLHERDDSQSNVYEKLKK